MNILGVVGNFIKANKKKFIIGGLTLAATVTTVLVATAEKDEPEVLEAEYEVNEAEVTEEEPTEQK